MIILPAQAIKIKLRPIFFGAFLVACLCMMQGEAQEISEGVTRTETTRADGTLVETLHLSQLPSVKYNVVNGCQFIAEYNTVVAPPITLRLGQKMILKIDPSYLYQPYFYFKKQEVLTLTQEGGRWIPSYKEQDAPLLPELSSWLSCFSWSQEPYDNPYSELYYQDWQTTTKGSVVLTFEGGTKPVDYMYMPITLKVSVTVI